MQKGNLLNQFISHGFCIDYETIYKLDILYINSFQHPSEAKQISQRFTLSDSNNSLKFNLLMKPTKADNYFDCILYIEDEHLIDAGSLKSHIIKSNPKATSFMQGMSQRKTPYYIYPEKTSKELEVKGYIYYITLEMGKSEVKISISKKEYLQIEFIPFESRNIAFGDTFEGEAIFFDRIDRSKLKTIWQTNFFMNGKKYSLKNVALEGYLWYASGDGSTKPRLGGRFRKDQPKYCTLFVLTGSDISDYFINREGIFILID